MRSPLASVLEQQLNRVERQIHARIHLVSDLGERLERLLELQTRLRLDRDEPSDRAIVVSDFDYLARLNETKVPRHVVLEVRHSDLFHGHMVAISGHIVNPRRPEKDQTGAQIWEAPASVLYPWPA